MFQFPATNKELFTEIDTYIQELPQPLSSMLMVEIYKLYVGHKFEMLANNILNDFAATQTDV